MTFNSSCSERVLPPIMIPSVSSNITPVLPPVSRLAPQVPRTALPADFSNTYDINLIPSPMHVPHTYVRSTPTVATKNAALNVYPTSPSSKSTPMPTLVNRRIHFDTPQYKQQSYSQTGSVGATPQITMTAPLHTHNNHSIPYHHQIYQQTKQFDPVTELLAEKRRRNAGASARFRDRRKQREREIQEKCRSLERRIQELECTDSAKLISELEKRLIEVNEEKNDSQCKLQELEKEIRQLRSRLCVQEFEFLTPPSSSGECDSKDSPFDISLRASRESSERPRKLIDVKSLLL